MHSSVSRKEGQLETSEVGPLTQPEPWSQPKLSEPKPQRDVGGRPWSQPKLSEPKTQRNFGEKASCKDWGVDRNWHRRGTRNSCKI